MARLAGLLTALVWGVVSGGAMVVWWWFTDPAPGARWLAAGLVLLLVLAALTVALAVPRLRYRHARYALDARGLDIRGGAFWRHAAAVPRSRLQHTDVSQGPIERQYGLATLVVHTAGTQNASIALEGLDHARALAMRDLLLQTGPDDPI